MRRYEAAIAELRKALEIDPSFIYARLHLGQAYAHSNRLNEAIAEFERSVHDSGGNLYAVGYLGYALSKAGRRDEAVEQLTKLQELSKIKFVPPYSIALVWMGLDDKEQMVEWLERACEGREQRLLYKDDRIFDPLHADPSFQSLLRRIGV